MSAYGDVLSAFPELLLEFLVFVMSPLAGGGFGPRIPFKKVTGYLTRDIGGLADKPDNSFVEGQQARFFVFDAIPSGGIDQGMYVEDDGDLFKFIKTDSFVREGGFTVYRLQLVSGETDRQVTNTAVEDMIINAY